MVFCTRLKTHQLLVPVRAPHIPRVLTNHTSSTPTPFVGCSALPTRALCGNRALCPPRLHHTHSGAFHRNRPLYHPQSDSERATSPRLRPPIPILPPPGRRPRNSASLSHRRLQSGVKVLLRRALQATTELPDELRRRSALPLLVRCTLRGSNPCLNCASQSLFEQYSVHCGLG
jgi:hypothetical protein